MSELFEVPEEIYDEEQWEKSLWEEHDRWVKTVRKKALADYKVFRQFSDIPYDYLREELEQMEFVESIGFMSGFDKVQRYGKICYQIRQTDIESLKAALSDPVLGWFDQVCFDKQDGCCDIFVPELDTEEECGYRTVEWEEYVHQRSDYWGDSYYGFFALPMNDGRFWLLYYKC